VPALSLSKRPATNLFAGMARSYTQSVTKPSQILHQTFLFE